MQSQFQWNKTSLVLHFIVAVAVCVQLLTSLGLGYGTWWSHDIFLVHMVSGSVALIAVFVFLVWKLVGPQGGFLKIYPWLSAEGWRMIGEDMKLLRTVKIPVRATGGGLAGVVQGLGLLLILAVAALGASWYYLGYANHVISAASASRLLHAHTTLAPWVWVYLGGHAGMAVLHWLLPERFLVAR